MTSKRERVISALPVKIKKREKTNAYLLRTARLQGCKDSKRSYMRGSPSTSRRVRVPTMTENMQEMMAREQAEALATLMKANRALERIFGIEEGEEDE
jgi:hypothetical protein